MTLRCCPSLGTYVYTCRSCLAPGLIHFLQFLLLRLKTSDNRVQTEKMEMSLSHFHSDEIVDGIMWWLMILTLLYVQKVGDLTLQYCYRWAFYIKMLISGVKWFL